jgi:hypothetical protein
MFVISWFKDPLISDLSSKDEAPTEEVFSVKVRADFTGSNMVAAGSIDVGKPPAVSPGVTVNDASGGYDDEPIAAGPEPNKGGSGLGPIRVVGHSILEVDTNPMGGIAEDPGMSEEKRLAKTDRSSVVEVGTDRTGEVTSGS